MPSHDLQRFLDAQSSVYLTARAELAAGQKRTHWMWFIFPQLAGLGLSATAQRYSLSGLEQARAYLAHAVLGERLRECVRLVTLLQGRTLRAIFGTPDDLKFHSSISLFALAAPDDVTFREALERYFLGQLDHRTVDLLGLDRLKPR